MIYGVAVEGSAAKVLFVTGASDATITDKHMNISFRFTKSPRACDRIYVGFVTKVINHDDLVKMHVINWVS